MTDAISAVSGRSHMTQAVQTLAVTNNIQAPSTPAKTAAANATNAVNTTEKPVRPADRPDRSNRPNVPSRPEGAGNYVKSAADQQVPVRNQTSERFEYLNTEDQSSAPAAGAEEENAAAANNGGRGERPEADEVGRAIETFKDYLESLPSEMNFSYDKEAERPIFRLVNPVTGEVVKQFPPDEFLTMVKRLREVSNAFDKGGALMDYRL